MKLLIGLLSLLVVSTQGNFNDSAYRHSYSKKTNPYSKKHNSSNSQNKFSIKGNVRVLFEDLKGNIWIGTDGDGAYKYDGKKFSHFSKKEGLIGEYVRTITQDKSGNIWFGTNEAIVSYNGLFFINHTRNKDLSYRSAICSYVDHKGTIWFGTRAGLYKFEGYNMSYLELPIAEDNKKVYLSEYSVYSILEDKDGSFYFGTENRGVCKFKDNTFDYINDLSLDKGAIRSIYKDKHGMLWFGNNGAGLYSYDGKTLRNISEEKGLNNPNFGKGMVEDRAGFLARIWSITEDITGNLWFGTIDAGAWRFDGKNMSNVTTKDGLQNNSVQVIMKDRSGRLWFGTGGGGISTFDGVKFHKIVRSKNDGC